MAVQVVFESATLPEDHLVWTTIAEAVLPGRDALVVARSTAAGWQVTLQGPDGFSTVAHPHSDGDFEVELRRALRAAGVRVAR
jgi:hypothetical protein